MFLILIHFKKYFFNDIYYGTIYIMYIIKTI